MGVPALRLLHALTFLWVCSTASWNGQGDELRTAHDAVARKQRNVVHDTGGGNELIRWIALEIEAGGGADNSKIERPYVYTVEDTAYVTVVQVNVYPAEVNQLGQFPQDNGRHRLSVLDQESLLGRPKFPVEREDQNMCVKIEYQHSSEHRSSKCRLES